jgi:class 3 adenylate cyclase/tetratricopeptide (TPR) repeat protein
VERRLASVLFVDIVDSTALVSGTDPEVARRRVTQFFERAANCVETHGGVVEKFAGDAVMAAFGVLQTHEDDAERAVRAGLAILEATDELGLEARAGIESGEVVVDGTDSTFATGEAVNIAARLQQAAAPKQLLIGPTTHRLSFGRVRVEDVGPLDVRGRAEPVWVWSAVGVNEGAGRAHTIEAPFVAREAELELLENTFTRAVRDRRAHLVTIYGEAGIGKSRLAEEFLESLEGATVLKGRCLPYGESVTYWPLAEMVKSAAGIADDDPLDVAIEKLRECCPADEVADLLGLASGVLEAVHGERSQQEIAWAGREWAELTARSTQPLVLVFEDIHWAEEPMLQLVEHMAAWVKDSPLMIVCLARTELLDVAPDWGGGRMRATSIELEPLRPQESEELVEGLLATLAGRELEASVRQALLDKTEGNPLFVEETVRMLIEAGGNGVPRGIPDTLQALIAARIDRLPLEHKTVLRRASVVGRIFWEGAIVDLCEELGGVTDLLEELVLRDFLSREQRSTISGETAYRFKHVLIREVAYGGLAKEARAVLHRRFAGWLRERAGEELLEIRAYHLDHAAALVAELDGAPSSDLAAEAALALQKAGKRALMREANRTARKLLLRAVELEPTLERRYYAAKAAWRMTDYPTLAREMEKVRAAAADAGDTEIEGLALTALAEVAVLREGDVPKGRELSDRALELLSNRDGARFAALATRTTVAWSVGHLDEHERIVREALELAREIESRGMESDALLSLVSNLIARLKLDDAEACLQQAIELAEETGTMVGRGVAYRFLGVLQLERGELEEAEAALEKSTTLLAEADAAWSLGRALNYAASVAWRRGSPQRAERIFRESIRVLKPLEDRATLCESQRGLAELLVELGRIDEAEQFAVASRETVGPEDVTSIATTTAALAAVRAAQGRDEEAEQLFCEALGGIEGTDFRRTELELLDALVGFLRDRGRTEDVAVYEERRAELLALRSGHAAAEDSAAQVA